MSFNNFARALMDPERPTAHRLSALRSCVQLYRPVGFQATLDFLQTRVGPFPRSPELLPVALTELRSSRDEWHREIERYTEQRRAAKCHGHRQPHRHAVNPYRPRVWYGAEKAGALHAVTFRLRHPGRIPPSVTTDEVLSIAASCAAQSGRLNPVELERLTALEDALRSSHTRDPYLEDKLAYYAANDLLGLIWHVRVAVDPSHGRVRS